MKGGGRPSRGKDGRLQAVVAELKYKNAKLGRRGGQKRGLERKKPGGSDKPSRTAAAREAALAKLAQQALKRQAAADPSGPAAFYLKAAGNAQGAAGAGAAAAAAAHAGAAAQWPAAVEQPQQSVAQPQYQPLPALGQAQGQEQQGQRQQVQHHQLQVLDGLAATLAAPAGPAVSASSLAQPAVRGAAAGPAAAAAAAAPYSAVRVDIASRRDQAAPAAGPDVGMRQAAEPELVLCTGAEAAAAARFEELEEMKPALAAALGSEGQRGLVGELVDVAVQLAAQPPGAVSASLKQRLCSLGLGDETLAGGRGLLQEPQPACARVFSAMVGLARAALAAGVQLAPQQQQQQQQQQQRQQQQQATGAGSSQAGGLVLDAVLAAYRSLDRRLADTCHAELRTSATTQAEVLAQLQSFEQLQGQDWVLVVPTGGSPAGIVARAVRSGMHLADGWCMACGNDGQQVSGAQPTNLHRLLLLGHAHLRLLERIMEGHASLLQARGQQAPWDPASPAHRALYGLALGMATPLAAAQQRRVGYYHPNVVLHSDGAVDALGEQLQPTLAPPPFPGCSMKVIGHEHTLVVQDLVTFKPGCWAWQNCTAWCLTDRLLGAAAAMARVEAQLPVLPGVTCALGIVTVAASLPVHVEDGLGGSVNQCWLGHKLWAFFPRGAVDRWATREQDRAQLMGKQLSLERLLSVPELLASCQLVLQPPGTLMVIPPGLAYHGVFAPGVCFAEASNHWHALGSGSGGQLARWLAQWQELAAGCPAAWQKRMKPLWCYFRRLKRFAGLKKAVNSLLRMQR